MDDGVECRTYVLADACQVTVPDRNVLVGDAGGDIEHDDGSLATNVVTITQTTELLLTSSVPAVGDDRATGGVESQRGDLDTHGRCAKSKPSNIFAFKIRN
jgi:hypothetical protein